MKSTTYLIQDDSYQGTFPIGNFTQWSEAASFANKQPLDNCSRRRITKIVTEETSTKWHYGTPFAMMEIP